MPFRETIPRYTKRMGITIRQYNRRYGVVQGRHDNSISESREEQDAILARMSREKDGEFWGYFRCTDRNCEYWSLWRQSDCRNGGSECKKCGLQTDYDDPEEDWGSCEHYELGNSCPVSCDFNNSETDPIRFLVYYWRTLSMGKIKGLMQFVEDENEELEDVY